MSKPSDEQIWQELIDQDWNLQHLRQRLTHPLTHYPYQPLLLTHEELKNTRLFDLTDEYLDIQINSHELHFTTKKFYSLIESTHAKLKENLSATNGPVFDYLQHEFATYETLADKRDYGFYAFYFTRSGELEALVQFPPVPTWKLALCSSPGQLLQNQDYTCSWLQARLLFARSHILVAGASVASATAENLIRDGRVGSITISDPKSPNATNFNRTNYDVMDIGSDEPKAISFARRMHRQDPTQIIYIYRESINEHNFANILAGDQKRPAVNVCVEAIDTLADKLAILQIAGQAQVPVVQISDVGSIAQISFQNALSRARGESLIFGLSDQKLRTLLQQDFVQVAARMVGLENAIKDELGRWVAGRKNTPFGIAMPQMGSTASVAAGIASEKILRFLLDCGRGQEFPYKRITIDKKNNRFHSYHVPSLQERALGLVMTIKNRKKH
ncbi:ThiF family adenylyltransferase [bacterium]|nr:ThiF family adenylyltransferase [bacterium]